MRPSAVACDWNGSSTTAAATMPSSARHRGVASARQGITVLAELRKGVGAARGPRRRAGRRRRHGRLRFPASAGAYPLRGEGVAERRVVVDASARQLPVWQRFYRSLAETVGYRHHANIPLAVEERTERQVAPAPGHLGRQVSHVPAPPQLPRGAIGSATDAGGGGRRWQVAFGAEQMGGGEVNEHG